MSKFKQNEIRREEQNLSPVGQCPCDEQCVGRCKASLPNVLFASGDYDAVKIAPGDRRFALPVAEVEELAVEEIELGACDCPSCTATIWDRHTGFRDLIQPAERVPHTPWPRQAKLFWAGYLGLLLAGGYALSKAFGVTG
jgi:hypothetical protein